MRINVEPRFQFRVREQQNSSALHRPLESGHDRRPGRPLFSRMVMIRWRDHQLMLRSPSSAPAEQPEPKGWDHCNFPHPHPYEVIDTSCFFSSDAGLCTFLLKTIRAATIVHGKLREHFGSIDPD
ncbi:hypothetical protein IAQ61_001873 [Plenodomus lingam]|uniref:Uncharacterized protein n=1 Tax=Leptosphaeria maculans (strain JN3 / isolate v23.1.3 / race Av1-4-5-6-7-8) TaxID=985895 RepID=E4ZGF4_LEPMJ|nr:predicted protein [Plenodomus lingam JN3]KAH9878601.1 hypothetical protein IAQ61_001873 [Plenodomus lingam]CBX90374.1 predicted protein [Plenodomus lingam JN3]